MAVAAFHAAAGLPACRARAHAPTARTCARLRDAGGFPLPPAVPAAPAARARALELLGAATQRSGLRPRVRAELLALVGACPPTREVAQQWKGALRLDAARRGRRAGPAAVRRPALQVTAWMGRVRLPPEDGKTSRAFVLLELLRWRYDAGEAPRDALVAEVAALIGCVPRSSGEAFKAKGALIRLARARRSAERRPPRFPDRDDDLRAASLLLGQCRRAAAVGGARGSALTALVGAAPRTRQVAAAWQKKVQYVIRRRTRKARVAANLAVADAKREERRAKREHRSRRDASALAQH